ncbi:hypothetical protein MEO39_27495, partial [Dolichospermum sp. ST_sed2]|nr:hypothetical protein [Dolichospermum sp. ST_sed2]
YLDTWIEIGLFGLITYLFLIINLFRYGIKLYHQYSEQQLESSLILGFLAGIIILASINVTTPYLNHPLGIGYLLPPTD